MSTQTSVKRHGGYRVWGPPLLLISPTILVLGVFVYGLIGAEAPWASDDTISSLA